MKIRPKRHLNVWMRIAFPATAIGVVLLLSSCSSGSRDPERLSIRLGDFSSSLAEVSEGLERIPEDSYWGRLAEPLREEADALNDRVLDAADQLTGETERVPAELARKVSTVLDDGQSFLAQANPKVAMMTAMEHVSWHGVAPVFGAATDQNGRPVFIVFDVEAGSEVALLEGDESDRPSIVPDARTGIRVGDSFFRFHAASIAYLGSGESARLRMIDSAGNEIGTVTAGNEVALSDRYADLYDAAIAGR